jgi:hypothetical protein
MWRERGARASNSNNAITSVRTHGLEFKCIPPLFLHAGVSSSSPAAAAAQQVRRELLMLGTLHHLGSL